MSIEQVRNDMPVDSDFTETITMTVHTREKRMTRQKLTVEYAQNVAEDLSFA